MALHKIGGILQIDGIIRARSAASARSTVMREIEKLLVADGFTRVGKRYTRRGAAPATSTLQPSTKMTARAANLRALIRAELRRASPAAVVKKLDALYKKAGVTQREGIAIATTMFNDTPAAFGASERRRRAVARGLGHREGKK